MDNKDFNLISNIPEIQFKNIKAKTVASTRTNSGYELDVNGTRWPIQKEKRSGYYNLEISNSSGIIGYLILRDNKPDPSIFPYTLEVTTPEGIKYVNTMFREFNKIRFSSFYRGGDYYRECHGTHRVDIYDYSGSIICQLKPWISIPNDTMGQNQGTETVVFPTICTNFEVPLPMNLTEILKMGFYRKIEAKSNLTHGLTCDLYNSETGWIKILEVQNYRTYNSNWQTDVFAVNFQKQ